MKNNYNNKSDNEKYVDYELRTEIHTIFMRSPNSIGPLD